MIAINLFMLAGAGLGVTGVWLTLEGGYRAVKRREFRKLGWGMLALAAAYGCLAMAAEINANV